MQTLSAGCNAIQSFPVVNEDYCQRLFITPLLWSACPIRSRLVGIPRIFPTRLILVCRRNIAYVDVYAGENCCTLRNLLFYWGGGNFRGTRLYFFVSPSELYFRNGTRLAAVSSCRSHCAWNQVGNVYGTSATSYYIVHLKVEEEKMGIRACQVGWKGFFF